MDAIRHHCYSLMTSLPIVWPTQKNDAFCQQWLVSELALFDSVLRQDFHRDSDIDILIDFSSAADWSLLDHVQMQQELAALLQRKVDLVSERALERSTEERIQPCL